ncbi:hypothetical protein ACLRAD_09985, partial [Gallibacterium anatis]
MKKTTLALILSSILANVAVAETAPTYVDITINNIKEDTGIELGTNSRARGDGSIATGKNSVAIGKNAVATGGNETKDTINQKLNENKQRLQEIQTAQDNTERLLKELQNIRKQQADVIEAGERVKQVRKSKATAKTAWDTALKAYNDAVASSAADIQAAQAKIDDFNSRLTAVSRIPNVDISSDEGVTRAATQFKSMVEDGTSMNMDIGFYKDYITSYYKAAGDLRQAYIKNNQLRFTNFSATNIITSTDYTQNIFFDFVHLSSDGARGFSSLKQLVSYVDPKADVSQSVTLINNKNDYIHWRIGTIGTSLSGAAISWLSENSPPSISSVTNTTTLNLLPKIDEKTDVASKDAYDKTLAYWQRVWDAVPDAVANYKSPFTSEADKENMKKWTYQNLLRYKASLDKVYYQGKYEETHDLSWLDKKQNVDKELQSALARYVPTETYYSMIKRYNDQFNSYYLKWKKENIEDVEEKNKITVSKLTSELAAALNVNKDAVQQIQNKLAALKQQADKAKQTYENINPSAADLALAANYDKVMSDLLNKSNSLKAEQERLDALKKALTLNDLTNVGENAYAIGTNALATGTNSLAIGTDTIVTGENSIAMGKGSVVTGTNSIAIGTGHNVLGNNSGAFGDPDYIYGDGSYAFGNDNTIGEATNPHNSGNNTFVLGSNVVTKANNAVILGANSTDGGDNTVSVGSSTAQRKIVYVADGTINQTSKDAINGSQIYDILQNATDINVANWQAKLGTGTNTAGNTGLITGDTLNTALSNVSAKLKVIAGTNTTVTTGTDGDYQTYAVNVSNNAIKAAIQTDLDSKANANASNITGDNKTKWQAALGDGKAEAGNTGLISGNTLHTA